MENQARSSTRSLVDTLAEHEILEQILEGNKPPLPTEVNNLHYLLAAPFRYQAPYPVGSRFRAAGVTHGVFYCAESVTTAMAEMVYYRLRFFTESPATPLPRRHDKLTVFSLLYRSDLVIDLTKPPFDAQRAAWTHPSEYTQTQALADTARQAGIGAIRYQSVRDPDCGHNIALLSPTAFTAKKPKELQQWQLFLSATEANCERVDVKDVNETHTYALNNLRCIL